MKVFRTGTKLYIRFPKNNEGLEVCRPNAFVAYYGPNRISIVADELEYLLAATNHRLTRLAYNALEAERQAKLTGQPRWLVYDPHSGISYETPYEAYNASRVEYVNGSFVWYNQEVD